MTTAIGLSEFVKKFANVEASYEEAMLAAMNAVGEIVAGRARGKLGTYQAEIGSFPAWPPLAESTLARKSEDTPLIETGQFLRDIDYEVRPPAGVDVGTHQDYIVFTEFGTRRMPPRPVFGPAALEKIEEIKALIGTAWLVAFTKELGG